MNFPSLFPRFKLRVWLCFNRPCRFRKMRGSKSRSGERDKKKKKMGVCVENTLFGLFRGDLTAFCQNELLELSVRQETAYMRSAFCLRHFKDPGVQRREQQTGALLIPRHELNYCCVQKPTSSCCIA